MLNNLPERPEILDIGCGSGMQTIELARICPDCRITATDIHQPFLDDLARRAEAAGVGERIATVQASKDDLPFEDASFDAIWAESFISIVGFGERLSLWKRLLRPGGYACVTEAVWFTDEPSPEAVAFWNDCYPAIASVEERPVRRLNVRATRSSRPSGSPEPCGGITTICRSESGCPT